MSISCKNVGEIPYRHRTLLLLGGMCCKFPENGGATVMIQAQHLCSF
jgi:hypothetical protein